MGHLLKALHSVLPCTETLTETVLALETTHPWLNRSSQAGARARTPAERSLDFECEVERLAWH